MKPTKEDLLTKDEAVALFAETAVLLADVIPGDALALERVLRGGRAPKGLNLEDRSLVGVHRSRVHHVLRAGHGGLLADEIAGVLSYAEYQWAHRPLEGSDRRWQLA